MKRILTLAACMSLAVLSLAQNTGGTVIRENGKTTAPDAVAVLNSVRAAVKTEANKPETLTEENYRALITNADRFFSLRKYDDATALYHEILQHRGDAYTTARLKEIWAIREKERQDEAQYRREAELLSRSRLLSSETAKKHAVHFSGAFMSDVSSDADWTSEAFNMRDPYSDFVAPGKYDNLSLDLQKSIGFTLDGIAVPAETRLIFYEKPGCTGTVLLDVTGPAIINNGYQVGRKRLNELSTKQFHDELQSVFPQSARDWSTTNMRDWTSGSMEIRMETKE